MTLEVQMNLAMMMYLVPKAGLCALHLFTMVLFTCRRPATLWWQYQGPCVDYTTLKQMLNNVYTFSCSD